MARISIYLTDDLAKEVDRLRSAGVEINVSALAQEAIYNHVKDLRLTREQWEHVAEREELTT